MGFKSKDRAKAYFKQWQRENRGKCNEYSKRWYERNRSQHLAATKKWKAANNEKMREWLKQWQRDNKSHINELRLIRKYGLTLKDWKELSIQQRNRCKICARKVKLHVDHNHKTNKVRGLLCANCNQALGLFFESRKSLYRAISYLETKS